MLKTPWLLLPLALFACGTPATDDTDTEDTDTEDTEVDGETDDTEADAISHATDIQSIWTSRCTPCHIASSSAGLSLVDAYDKIVDVASAGDSAVDLIEPGSAADSYLFRKISNTGTFTGGSMPPGGAIPQAEIDLIEDWIEGGAAE